MPTELADELDETVRLDETLKLDDIRDELDARREEELIRELDTRLEERLEDTGKDELITELAIGLEDTTLMTDDDTRLEALEDVSPPPPQALNPKTTHKIANDLAIDCFCCVPHNNIAITRSPAPNEKRPADSVSNRVSQ